MVKLIPRFTENLKLVHLYIYTSTYSVTISVHTRSYYYYYYYNDVLHINRHNISFYCIRILCIYIYTIRRATEPHCCLVVRRMAIDMSRRFFPRAHVIYSNSFGAFVLFVKSCRVCIRYTTITTTEKKKEPARCRAHIQIYYYIYIYDNIPVNVHNNKHSFLLFGAEQSE